ncbi:MAG TPA: NIPSNAP family containing protein [Chitinophagaceae bacterium]|nr:NIPSNAP family containing protein [Chitinophagaceae bacterium]
MKKFLITLCILYCGLGNAQPSKATPKRSFYQLRVYHYTKAAQEQILDDFAANALLPALHRQKLGPVGVFKSHGNDTASDKTLTILIPLQDLNKLILSEQALQKDTAFIRAAQAYSMADYTNPPYARIETILLQAFSTSPQLQLPKLDGARRTRIYELRSYESATEKIFANKLHMFNEGDETGLFQRLHFNAAFYGAVVAGSKMPNLMYLTCHENKLARENNWKRFVESPEWKKLSTMPEYQHNVSHIDIQFLYPTEYSDY